MSQEPWKPDVCPTAPGFDCEGPAPPYSLTQACSSQSTYNQPAPPYSAPQMGLGYGQGHCAPYQPPGYYALPSAGAASSSATVIINQPQSIMGSSGRRLWSTKMCDCCQDMSTCKHAV